MPFPTSPTNGALTTQNGISYVYDAAYGSWTRIPWVTYSASPTKPTSAKAGDQWYKTDVDILYEYINDGTNNYWVDTQSQSIAAINTSIDNNALNAFLLAGM
ncbi:MAG: hypothetical protein WCG15_10195 [Actinomycetes bacterium]|jgi:hypothetical protein